MLSFPIDFGNTDHKIPVQYKCKCWEHREKNWREKRASTGGANDIIIYVMFAIVYNTVIHDYIYAMK